jgi:uncharacterized protein YecE (DUF72 family)
MGREQYFRSHRFLELDSTFQELPAAAVLQRWRSEAPAEAGLAAVAWQVITHRPESGGYARIQPPLDAAALAQAGGLRDTPVVRDAVARTAEVTRLLQAEVVVFRTAPTFAPSAGNRELLRSFFTEVAPAERFGNAVRVWQPQGLWEPLPAATLAEELGLVYAYDPLANDPQGPSGSELAAALPGSHTYLRITGMGRGARTLPEHDLEELLEVAGQHEKAWIVLATAERHRDARRLAKLAGLDL